jgi:hypothetical protein
MKAEVQQVRPGIIPAGRGLAARHAEERRFIVSVA